MHTLDSSPCGDTRGAAGLPLSLYAVRYSLGTGKYERGLSLKSSVSRIQMVLLLSLSGHQYEFIDLHSLTLALS